MKQKSIKNIRKEFKENGIFYTPPELAKKLLEYVDIKPQSVYDPTCGAGNLLKVFPDGVKKYGQEIDEEQIKLIDIPNFTGYAGDVLIDDGLTGKEFDCILANPPFSVRWDPELLADDERFSSCSTLPPPSKADWAFMLHILSHLSRDGVGVVLEFPGILYRGQREGKVREWFIEKNYIDRVVNIPGNTFEDTAICTCIVVLKKNKRTTDIMFEDDGITKRVALEDIRKNGYGLSPSNYIQHEKVKEVIDPIQTENDARQGFIKRLRAELEFESQVCSMQKISIMPFLNALEDVIKEFKKMEG